MPYFQVRFRATALGKKSGYHSQNYRDPATQIRGSCSNPHLRFQSNRLPRVRHVQRSSRAKVQITNTQPPVTGNPAPLKSGRSLFTMGCFISVLHPSVHPYKSFTSTENDSKLCSITMHRYFLVRLVIWHREAVR